MQNTVRWHSDQFWYICHYSWRNNYLFGTPGQTKVMQIQRTLPAQYECCYSSQFNLNHRKWCKVNLSPVHCNFVPIWVETMGVWGAKGHKFIKDLGRLIRKRTMDKKCSSFLYQAISMELQRGNCAMCQCDGHIGES